MAKYPESDPLEQEEKWGMPLRNLYRLALSFYKQNSGKAIHLSYEDNLKLVAFTKQATNGPYNEKCAPALGVLDYIGKDRRQYWQQLGDMGKVQSMEGFINLLDRMCSSFKPYIEAVKQDNEAKLKLELQKNVESMKKLEKEKQLREKEQLLEEERYKEEIQRRQLKDALNQQTYQQFKSYAEKQFPGSPEEQAILIRQLQKEHYHQYMQQLHLNANAKPTIPPPSVTAEESETIENDSKQSAGSEQGIYEKNESENDEYVVISPAKMWTRPDIKAFKKDVAAGSGDGVINVGHGDIVTVRVPTNSNGKCIFWEFATDNYDIGFGVFFEWSPPVTNDVTVHVSESDDDDFYDDEDYLVNDDLECGSVANVKSVEYNKAPISIIVPIYRRECFNEVYVGSHAYPGQGVYLLKFDNSFSIWRSKMLYYRVYYER